MNSLFLDAKEFLGGLDEKCDIQLKTHLDGVVSFQFRLYGAGWGELGDFMYQLFTMDMRQEATNRMMADFKERKQ